jgi:type VI protein secretion system component VasF
LLLNFFFLVVCLAFLGAYTVYKHVAQEHVLTPPSFIAALTQAGKRESHRWRASKVVYYSLRHVKKYE